LGFEDGFQVIGNLSGRPNIILQNMPGAGSMTAANYMYSVAKWVPESEFNLAASAAVG
jgi:hypothetical protein